MHGDATTGLIYLGIMFLAYFLPAIVACNRGHHNRLAITVLNLVLGWTLLGWLIALVWACTAVRRQVEFVS